MTRFRPNSLQPTAAVPSVYRGSERFAAPWIRGSVAPRRLRLSEVVKGNLAARRGSPLTSARTHR
jgi:hypothetical protein